MRKALVALHYSPSIVLIIQSRRQSNNTWCPTFDNFQNELTDSLSAAIDIHIDIRLHCTLMCIASIHSAGYSLDHELH